MTIMAMRETIGRIISNGMPDHPGLAFSRYNHAIDALCEYEEREKMLEYMINRISPATLDIYNTAFKQWKKVLDADHPWSVTRSLPSVDRLFVGLGNESVLEFGIHFHPVYGLPRIPGSTIKGVCSRYASEIWGRSESDWKQDSPLHKTLFGSNEPFASSGAIDFFDAWWIPDKKGPFVPEIINTHHQKYYTGDDGSAPSDWDSPIPIKMVAVTGSFLFAARGPAYWNDLAMNLLIESLGSWGIGGKTRAGYGRFNASAESFSEAFQKKSEVWEQVLISWNAGGGGIAKVKGKDGKTAEIKGETEVKRLVPLEYYGQLFNHRKKQTHVKCVTVELIGGKKYKILKVE